MRRALRTLVPAVTAVVLGVLTTAVTPLPAWATVTRLCVGYSACANAGMGNGGYAQHNGTMYWRMYSGHNCTNYAAYRMVASGLPNERPWSGGGNATYWGQYMSSITDQTPRVGAVAWWRAGVYPAGSAGHVGYVEKVVSPTEIIISQDNWGGDFMWTRVTKSSSGWPSGFIHFNDVPLRNTAKPTISGDVKVGSVLTATAGGWNPSSPTTTYQWQVAGQDVDGATASTLTLRKWMRDKRVRVVVTAAKLGYPTTTAASARTAAVMPGVLRATTAPTLSGEPQVDQTLTATSGTWSPQPDSIGFQWYADGNALDGATDPTLTATPAMEGKTLSVQVTARRAGYTPVTVTSTASGPVAPGALAPTGDVALSGGSRPGDTLRASVPAVEPSAHREVRWLRDDTLIRGATGRSYQLTRDDLGHRVTAQAQWTRDGYTPLVLRAPASSLVRSVPDVKATWDSGRGRVVVHVTVTAPGVDQVPAVVRIRSHGQVVAEKHLTDGAAVLRVTDQRAGTRTYRLVARATDVTERARVDREVTIL